MKTLQKFSNEYLEQCKTLTPEQILRFLQDFQILQSGAIKEKSILISIKVPETLLRAFRRKAEIHRIPYQTMIKDLMKAWLKT